MAKLSVEYCNSWGYYDKAVSLTDKLKQVKPGLEVDLVESTGGVFEITYNGAKIFSKKAEGRFPNPGEVEAKLS